MLSGLLPANTPLSTLEALKARFRAAVLKRAVVAPTATAHQAVAAFCDPFGASAHACGPWNAAGPTLVAFQHSLPNHDVLPLILRVHQEEPARPLGVVASFRTIRKLVPDWEARWPIRVFQVEWETDGTGRERVINGPTVLKEVASWATGQRNPVLFLAPEGATRQFLAGPGKPLRGLGWLASRLALEVVPAVTHGNVNLADFHLDVQASFLPPLPRADSPSEIAARWYDAVTEALSGSP